MVRERVPLSRIRTEKLVSSDFGGALSRGAESLSHIQEMVIKLALLLYLRNKF